MQRITPDMDMLIVVEANDQRGIVEYVNFYRKQWATINMQLQDEADMGNIYDDKESALDLFVQEDKLLLDLIYVPDYIWNDVPVFVQKDEINRFKFMRDLLFSLKSTAKNKSSIPEEYLQNYVLQNLLGKGRVNSAEMIESLIIDNPYADLIALYPQSRKIVEEKFQAAIDLAVSRQLIHRSKGEIFVTRQGQQFLGNLSKRRQQILENGYSEKEESYTANHQQWLEDGILFAQQQKQKTYLTSEFTKNSFHIFKGEFKQWFEGIEDGTELHFAAPGGGGDTLGTIFLIKILKHTFKLMGKKDITFKIIFPSIKYGKENPFGGDLSIDYVEGISSIDIDGVGKSHFYSITDKLKARIPITDKNGEQLVINGEPVFYEKDWSEGNILDLAKEDGVELVMMDITQPAKDLRRQYELMVKGKKIKSSFIDMGGDSLAQIFGPITSNSDIEAPVASPVSDLSGLVIFDGPAWILALGGDGESFEKTQEKHVSTLYEKDQIAAIFDLEKYLGKRYQDDQDMIDIFNDMDEYAKRFSSEVSKNLFERLKHLMVNIVGESPVERYGPGNYQLLLKKHNEIEDKKLRYEKREEFTSRLYSSIIVIDSTQSMRDNIVSKEVLDGDMTWHERKRLLRDKYNYSTEGIFYVVFRSKIKNFSDMFLDMLHSEKAKPTDILRIFFSSDYDIEYQLAAIRAFYQNSHFINGSYKATETIGKRLVQMMEDAKVDPDMHEQNVFLIAEIAKTLGIIGYDKAINTLKDFMDNPKDYGHWPFFNLYFYKYAHRRIVDTTERSIRMLIEKKLSREGPFVAEKIFNEVNGTHPEFEGLRKLIELKKAVFKIKQTPFWQRQNIWQYRMPLVEQAI